MPELDLSGGVCHGITGVETPDWSKRSLLPMGYPADARHEPNSHFASPSLRVDVVAGAAAIRSTLSVNIDQQATGCG